MKTYDQRDYWRVEKGNISRTWIKYGKRDETSSLAREHSERNALFPAFYKVPSVVDTENMIRAKTYRALILTIFKKGSAN